MNNLTSTSVMIIHSGFADVKSDYIWDPIKLEQIEEVMFGSKKQFVQKTYEKTAQSSISASILEIVKTDCPKHTIIPLDIENTPNLVIKALCATVLIAARNAKVKFVVNYCLGNPRFSSINVIDEFSILMKKELEKLAKFDNVFVVVPAGNDGKLINPLCRDALIPQCLTDSEGIVVVGSVDATTRKIAQFSSFHDQIFYYPHKIEKAEDRSTRIAATLMTSYIAKNWKDQTKSEITGHLKETFCKDKFLDIVVQK